MIIQLKDGQVIGKYATVAEASLATDIIETNIYAVLRGSRLTAGGCEWRRNEEELPENESGPEVPENTDPETSWTQESDYAMFSGSISGKHLNTLEEVLAFCKADLTVWDVKEHQFKHWTTAMKKKVLVDSKTGKSWQEGVPFEGQPIATHKEIVVPNTGWTVKFVLKNAFKDKILEVLKSHIGVLPPTPVRPHHQKGRYAVEFAIFDHHLGKTGFDPHTLQSLWSIDEALAEYQNVIDFGLDKVDLSKVDHFILPFGNDGIHVDSYLGTTTSGTRIGSDTLWLSLFRYHKEAIIRAIMTLKEYAPVYVYGVPGNHDYNGTLAMSEVILEAFKDTDDVRVICSGLGREWHTFGRTLIGYHHGDKCDARKAHTMMITDVPHLIQKNQYRAVHVGHTHRSAKSEIIPVDTRNEEFGLVYEICPSLCPTDVWHSTNLFIGNLRRSKIFGYEKDRGLEFEFIYNKL